MKELRSRERWNPNVNQNQARSAYRDNDFFDRHIADLKQGNFDSGSDKPDEIFQAQSEIFTTETLIAAYNAIKLTRSRELTVTGRRIPALVQGTTQGRSMRQISSRPLAISTPVSETFGVIFPPPCVLQNWEYRLKSLSSTKDDAPSTVRTHPSN
ncbi:hypothetical protein N7527_006678 [Penicillium freii]|nr:hypothetical protein N7527_006678 [Penicillium freii]